MYVKPRLLAVINLNIQIWYIRDDKILLKKIQSMLKLTIFLKSQDIFTISSVHFVHGGHFANMQIRIIHEFGYITSYLQWRIICI